MSNGKTRANRMKTPAIAQASSQEWEQAPIATVQ